MIVLANVIELHFTQNLYTTLNVRKGGSMMTAQRLVLSVVIDVIRIIVSHLLLFHEYDEDEGKKRAYLEACKHNASNQTYINGLLAPGCRPNQVLNSLVVLFQGKSAFSVIPYRIDDGPVSCFEALV